MKHFDYAHFNKRDLPVLDKIQGKTIYVPGTQLRHYRLLEDHIPHIANDLIVQAEKHRRGGNIGEHLRELDKRRMDGRRGDSEIALIGPDTKKVLSHVMHGHDYDPHSKRPEFYGVAHKYSDRLSSLKRNEHARGDVVEDEEDEDYEEPNEQDEDEEQDEYEDAPGAEYNPEDDEEEDDRYDHNQGDHIANYFRNKREKNGY